MGHHVLLPALFAALTTVCAGAAGFGDVPDVTQLVFLLTAAVFAAAFYLLAARMHDPQKRGIARKSICQQIGIT
jgi:ABC-type Na+ efflux pump permease subunit